MKIHKIPIPIYFGFLIITFSDDFKKAVKKLKLDTTGHPNYNQYAAFTIGKANVKTGVLEYYLIFDKKAEHSVIAHEVLHCMHWIFHDRNITPDFINDEPQAYLIGWITKQIYKYKP